MRNSTNGRQHRIGAQFYSTHVVLAGSGSTTRIRSLAKLSCGALAGCYLVLMFSPSGPSSRFDALSIVLVGIGAVHFAMWSTREWPSRAVSGFFVMSCTVAVAASCLSLANPVIGLLGSTLFAVVTAYAMLFHPYFAVCVVGVAAMTATVLAYRIVLGGDPALAAAALVMVAVVNASSFVTCRVLRENAVVDITDGELDPLTGMFNRDAFDSHTSTLIGARSRDGDRYLVLTVLEIDDLPLLALMRGNVGVELTRAAHAQAIKRTLRWGSVVGHVEPDRYLIAEVMSTPDPTPVVDRVRSVIEAVPPHLTASIGSAVLPMVGICGVQPDLVITHLLKAAAAEMEVARRAGGGQARHVFAELPSNDEVPPADPP